MKSPTPLTLRIPKDQLLSTKRSPPPSSTPSETGKQQKGKVQPILHGQQCVSGLVFKKKEEREGGWKRGKVRERERRGEGGCLMIFELEESR